MSRNRHCRGPGAALLKERPASARREGGRFYVVCGLSLQRLPTDMTPSDIRVGIVVGLVAVPQSRPCIQSVGRSVLPPTTPP